MKKIMVLTMASFLIFGCSKDKENDLIPISINLLTTDNPTFFEKTVILFEDNNFLIKINFDIFIGTYPFDVIEGYEEITDQAIQDSNDQAVLSMADYLKLPKYGTFTLAHHLEKGTCLIFDKNKNEIIATLEMEEYMVGKPMMATKGRRFFIKGTLFLETVDQIS